MYEQLFRQFEQHKYSEIIAYAATNDISPLNEPRCAHILAAAHFSLGQVKESVEILVELESSLGDDDSYLSLFGAALRRMGDF